MDGDVFPNQLDYWGPNGMVFFRNVQLRWMPVQGPTRVWVALEQPGASGDGGVYSDRVELQNIKPRFPLPDLTAQVRSTGDWGHVQLAGLLREIKWDDTLPDQFDLSGSTVGWGLNLSSVINATKNDAIRLEVTYGQGCENYMNDAPGRRRRRRTTSESGEADRGQGAPDARDRRLPRPQLEQVLLDGGRLLADRHRQHERPGGRRLQGRPVRPREPPLDAPPRASWRGSRGSGGTGRTISDGFSSTDWRIQMSVQGQLLVDAGR